MSRTTKLLVCLTALLGCVAAAPAAAVPVHDPAPAPAPDAVPARDPVPALTSAAARAAQRLLTELGVRTVMVALGDDLVAVRSARDGGPDRATNIKSASKSLIGALVGIAIAHGDLAGVHVPVAPLLPQRVASANPDVLRRIDLENLLTMTAGLESTSGEHYGAWVASGNWLRAALTRPVVAPPGERFVYSTANTHLLGVVLARAVGKPLPEYARRVLLGPLGVSATWARDPQGNAFGGNNLTLTPRGLLRFGQMMAAGGLWEGRQLVPRSWIERSTRPHSEGWPDRYGAYGYLWWLPEGEPELWLAAGYAGQFLVVAPSSRLVVVVTSTLEPKGAAWDGRVLGTIRELAREASR